MKGTRELPMRWGFTGAFCEALFALNVGFSLALVLRAQAAPRVARSSALADVEARMITWFNSALHRFPRGYNRTGVELTFACWILAIGLLAELVLRFCLQNGRGAKAFSMLAGFAALLGLPTAVLYAYIFEHAGTFMQHSPIVDLNRAWLLSEIFITLALLIFYFRFARRQLIPVIVTVTLLGLHYALWSWILWHVFSPASWAILLSAVPSAAGAAWAMLEARITATSRATYSTGWLLFHRRT